MHVCNFQLHICSSPSVLCHFLTWTLFRVQQVKCESALVCGPLFNHACSAALIFSDAAYYCWMLSMQGLDAAQDKETLNRLALLLHNSHSFQWAQSEAMRKHPGHEESSSVFWIVTLQCIYFFQIFTSFSQGSRQLGNFNSKLKCILYKCKMYIESPC